MLRVCSVLAAAVAVAFSTTRPATAFPQFQKAFIAEYASDNADYEKLLKKEAKCNLCHQGKKKSNMNVYGTALDELLTKADKKDTEKIVAALKEVAEKPSVADDDSSPTFGDLIKAGKLPVDLETAKKEPGDL